MTGAEEYHARLIEDARLPRTTESHVLQGDFQEQLANLPEADINIFGLAREMDSSPTEIIVRRTRSSCLFVCDSGRESALA